MKSIANILVLILLGIGLIAAFLEMAILINRPFAYIIGAGLSVLTILGAFEIFERSK